MHALCAYFDIAFTQTHTPIRFSTGPHAQYTHWKQTVFYLDHDLTVCAGEELHGTIKTARNAKNPRDLDISLDVKFKGRHSQCDNHQDYRLR